MNIVQSILTNNPCYTSGKKITVKGLMLHSVGCPQPSASVFVKNWNSASYDRACVHGFIDANSGTVYQTLPWNHRGWHAGGGANNTHIGVEMCEPACIKYTGGSSFTCSDKATAKACVERTYNSAVQLFASLCKTYNLNPLADGVIISHKEGCARGIASNHGDPEHLWKGLGLSYTMNTFRSDVSSVLNGGGVQTLPDGGAANTGPSNASASGEATYNETGSWTVASDPVVELDDELELTRIQPLYPFVEISVGNITLTDFGDDISDTVIDFNYTRKSYYTDATQTGSKFSLSLYDDSALEIEEAIVSNLSEGFTVRYGYAVNGQEKYATQEFHGIAEKYGLAFEGASVTLTIDGSISTVDQMAGSVATETYDSEVYEGKPSKIVERICIDEGWPIGQIEETEPVLDDDGSVKTFNRTSERASTFIHSLTEVSVSASTGSSPYRFFVGEDGKVYFVSINNIEVPTAASTELENKVLGSDDTGYQAYGTTRASASYETTDGGSGSPHGVTTTSTDQVSKRYWIGDSRFNGMKSFASSTDQFIAKDSQGHSWLTQTAIPSLKSSLKNQAGEVVIFGLGVNDIAKIDKYIDTYKSLMNQYPNVKFVITSITPVYDPKTIYVKNSQIESFNAKMRSAFPNNFVDVYSQVKGSVTASTTDSEGLHYTNDLKKTIFNIISNSVGGMSTNDTSSSNTGTSSSSVGSVRPVIITKKYEFYSGRRNNTVISFTPEYQGIAVSMLSNASSASVDTVRNEMIECTIDGSYVGNLSKDEAKKIMGLSSSSYKNLEQKSASMWSYYSTMSYGATLEIMGDPTVKVGTYLYITVFTKYGYPHHTSGIYYIKQAEDNISGGQFTTTLTLLKAGSSISNVQSYVEGDSSYIGNSDDFIDTGGVAANADVEKAIQWALGIASDNSHGYTYGGSHGSEGTEYDCSSFVSWAFKHAGFGTDICTTGNMRSNFTAHGFVWHPGPFSVSDLKRGDIVLDEDAHVELYIGNGQNVGAHSNKDGKPGDSGGNEISVGSYYNGSWDGYLRYGG